MERWNCETCAGNGNRLGEPGTQMKGVTGYEVIAMVQMRKVYSCAAPEENNFKFLTQR